MKKDFFNKINIKHYTRKKTKKMKKHYFFQKKIKKSIIFKQNILLIQHIVDIILS